MKDSKLPPNLIEKRVVEHLGTRFAYALLDPQFKIKSTSFNFNELAAPEGEGLQGMPLADLFPELIGLEESMGELLSGDLEALNLDAVNRLVQNGSEGEEVVQYFNFTLFPADRRRPGEGLIFLIEEVSDQANLRQDLVQERNQLRLTQGELARANRELQRLDQIKTLFLSMAAHDMRTPLSVISGYIELIQDMIRDDEPQDKSLINRDLTIMQDQVHWLNRLILNVLDLNLIENELLVVDRQPFDMRLAVEQVARSTQNMFKNARQHLSYHVPTADVFVLAESDRIKQVLFNLVGNSFKFISRGGRVHIDLRSDIDRQKAILAIEDDGPGIDKAYQKHLFKLHYRTPESNEVQGTGLGLYIVKKLVDQHEGTIWVESEVGQGTRFVIELPLLSNLQKVS
ncbi:MAG: HAMP domain-containing sensor histidine kinase [Ardenticatenaceae bacterium]|nr:HAMP domain-containing sensor histidine kinase [Ardenticatenaceae bacterium]